MACRAGWEEISTAGYTKRKQIDMAFNIKKVRPLFTGVITTANTYVGEVTAPGGLILDVTKREGSLNNFQTVVSVGKMVTDVKPGDIVCLNFKRYTAVKHLPGTIGEDNLQSDNMVANYEIPQIVLNGVPHLFIQNNDIEFVVEDFDGVDDGGLLQ